MPLIRETVQLLVQAAGACHLPDDRRGLRDREWTALRFLARANRFSRTPTALADYLASTRATATQIVKALVDRSLVARRPSQRDKRSVVLCVTPQGERLLAQHDPTSSIATAVAALVAEDCLKLRNSLDTIVKRIATLLPRATAAPCRGCVFLRGDATGARSGRARPTAEYQCRLHRASITVQETALLCTSFEPLDDD
ncbi:MarR family transcriptional regulator [Bradyrhizobium rifense]|uniref:MarR family transcriptional regulator n=1 Tax=Bradyrhizobium rifense TaxID=515499 RepID=A0A5D3KJ19_9BRAD|nr:MarR family transcriptional regulator [Bradyrhizobium rifense]TYL93940.1 MarR family transcriptional regulator [Bradyrhizobium rifense]